jgi:hypothetical protein
MAGSYGPRRALYFAYSPGPVVGRVSFKAIVGAGARSVRPRNRTRLRESPAPEPSTANRPDISLLFAWPRTPVFAGFFDGFLRGRVSAEGAGVPAVALVHGPFPLPIAGAPPLGSDLRPMGGPVGAIRDRLLNRAVHRLFARGLPVLNQARREQGLGPLDDWFGQLFGVEAIYVPKERGLVESARRAWAGRRYNSLVTEYVRG